MAYANMNPDDFCRTCDGEGLYRYDDQREGRTVTVTDQCHACNGTGCKVFYLNGGPVVSTSATDGFEPARRALQDVMSSDEVVAAAVDVLSASTDPDDIATVRVWRNHLWAQIGSELNAMDQDAMARAAAVPFDEMLMPFTTKQIAIMCVLVGAALIIMTVGHYLLWGMADAF